jgi:Flp pilus assembly protein TadG
MKTPILLKKYVHQGNNRGIAVIYLALLLFALVGIVALAIDIGYKYYAWTQLQNAADSASLAGVSRLPKFPATKDKTAFSNLSAARREAWRFAAKNAAANKSVFLIQSSSHVSPPNDLNNNNDQNGDIVVGHWSKTGGFTPADGTNAINAVKVVSRRIKTNAVSNVSIGDNPLPTFFGRIFKINEMNAESDAIAAATPGATNYILMCSTYPSITNPNPNPNPQGLACTASCTYPNICPISPARVLDKNAAAPYADAFAWTSLAKQNTPSSYLNDMACGRIFPNEDVCSVPIYTTQGQTSTFKAMESAMYDPHFDSANKEFDASGNVIAWWVIIPVSNRCPPDIQPPPYTVERFALIRLVQVCGSGGGNACSGNNYTATSCPYGPNNKIALDRFSCMDCAQRNLFMGLKLNLVE